MPVREPCGLAADSLPINSLRISGLSSELGRAARWGRTSDPPGPARPPRTSHAGVGSVPLARTSTGRARPCGGFPPAPLPGVMAQLCLQCLAAFQGGDDDIDPAAGGRDGNCSPIHSAQGRAPGHGSGLATCRAVSRHRAHAVLQREKGCGAGLFTARAAPLASMAAWTCCRRRRCDRVARPRPARPRSKPVGHHRGHQAVVRQLGGFLQGPTPRRRI